MISIRIYKDIPQGKLVVNFRTSPRGVHKQSSSIILSYMPLQKIMYGG